MSYESEMSGRRADPDLAELLSLLLGTGAAGIPLTAIDLLPAGVIVVAGAREPRILYANAAFQEIVGCCPEPGMLGSALGCQYYPPGRETPLRPGQLLAGPAIGGGETVRNAEIHVRRPDGAWRVVLASATPIRTDAGAAAVAVFQDITQQKEADERANHLASFPEKNPNPVVETDLDGNVTYANPAALALFPDLPAAGPAHPFLQDIQQAVAPCQREGRAAVERDVCCSEVVFRQRIYCAAGSRVLHLYAVDVTERERAKEALREANERLEIQAAALQAANEELQAANEELQAQSEELQAANEELQAQTEELQAQTEELQAQTEELAVQARDLEQANDRLRQSEETLRRSEALYRAIARNIPGGAVLVVDRDLRYLAADGSLIDRLGLPREEMEGRTAGHILGEESRVVQRFRWALAGETNSFEGEFLGRGVWALFAPLRDDAGQVFAAMALGLDVTERRQAELERVKTVDLLREREAELRLVIECAPAFISYVDADCRYRRVNHAYVRMFGESAGTLQGRHMREVLGEEIWQTACPHVERALAGEHVTFEANSGDLWWHVTYAPDQDSSGRVRGFVVHAVDISERKWAGEALRQSEMRHRIALDAASLGTWQHDLATDVMQVDARARTHWGFESDEVSLADVIAKLHPDDLARIEESIKNAHDPAVSTGRYAVEHRVLDPDGGVRWMSVQARVLFEGEGAERRPTLAIGTSQDISEHKLLEEELQQAQKMEAVGRLAGGVAHDFNNVLMPIMTYGQMLCDRLEPGSRPHHWAVEIATAAERAAGLPRQLLAFSRKQIIQPQVLDLNATVTGIEKMLQRLIGEDIRLRAVPGSGLGKVMADPGQIEQVIVNLAVNARDAMSHGGRLTVETANVDLDDSYTRRVPGLEPGRYVMLAVSDTGCGIEKATLSRIFEPFFTTKEVGKGTGLGLSTVHGIVKQSGGEIRVYSEPGHGTTFRIYLPRVDAPTDAVEAERASRPARGTETLLVVEDEEGVRDAMREILEPEGYAVLSAGSGEEGLVSALSHSGPIHLLVTDVVMPGMSGRQLAEQIAKVRPETRVLFMSGYTEDAIVHHGVLDEGIAFLQKPFAPGVLLRKVREVLDAPPDATKG